MAVSYEDIAAYISNVLAGEGSDADKAATINDAAAQYGVSQADIAAATGYDPDVVSSYLGPSGDSSPLSSVGDAPSGGGALSNVVDTALSDTSFVDNSPLSSVFTGPSPEDLRTAALNAQWEAQQARDTNINTFIQGVLNNPNLDDYQRALAINQSGIGTREEIASATRSSLADVNKFLDQKAPDTFEKPSIDAGRSTIDTSQSLAGQSLAGQTATYDSRPHFYDATLDTAYWDSQLGQLQQQVNSFRASGATEQEVKAQLWNITGSREAADYIAGKTLAPTGSITDNFTSYVTPKTIDGQQYQVLDISKVLDYAEQNNLPLTTVVKELSAQFPNLKASDLQYEKDRQAVASFIKTDPNDATKSTLSYTDALTAALQQGVSVDNLAKFFGQTPQQFTQTVKDNLGTFASTLKDAKLDPVTGLKSLLGIEAGDTTKALQEKAIQNDFATFASGFNKDNPLTYQKLGDYLDQKNISMQQAKDLLGFAPSELATFRFTPEQRDVRQAYDTYTTQFNKDNPQTIQDLANFATANKLDAYQAAVALGLSDATTAALNNELKFSPQERAWREAAQTSTAPITFKQASDFQLANKLSDADMERIFNIPTANLEQYRATSAIQSSIGNYVDPISGKDYTPQLTKYVSDALKDLGISGTDQIEARVIPGTAGGYTYQDSGEGGQVAVYDPGTPDKTVYINKATGKEIDPLLFDDKAGTRYLITDQGIQKEFDPGAKLAAQSRAFIDPKSFGGAWTTKSGASSGPGFGQEGMIQEIGQRIYERTGISDINNLALKTVDAPLTERVYAFTTDDGTQYAKLTGMGDDAVWTPLTSSEKGKLRSELDEEGNPAFFVDSTVKQGQVYDKVTGKVLANNGELYLGDWGQGPGVTHLSISFDKDGKPVISTYGEDTTDPFVKMAAKAGPLVTIANVLSGGALTPLQLAVSGISAADAAYRGNYLPALAVAAGAAGEFGLIDPSLASNIQAGIGAYNAAKEGNVLGALVILGGSPLGSDIAGIDLGGGLTVNDALNAASAIDRAAKGDYAGAITLAGKALGSAELQTAGSAASFISAIKSGDLSKIATTGTKLYNNVTTLVNNSQVASLLVNSAGIGAIDADAGTAATGPIRTGALANVGVNPTEDELIAFQQRTAGINQALSDYFSSGSDLSREGLVSQLQRFGMDANRAELVAQNADKEIEMSRVGADVLARYSQIDPEFGGPALARDTALQEMVVAGFSSDRANALLNGIEAQNAIKLENKLSTQAAFNDFTSGKGTEEQLRSALTSAGYTDAQINNLVTRANAIIEGGKLTPGEKVQERAANLVDIRGEIAGKSSFNEAYATAREKLGSGASFTWNGKTYTTADPVVTKPSDTATASLGTPYVAPNGMHNRAAFIQAGGGTSAEDYAKYVQAVNALVSEGKSGTLIKPSSVNSTGKELPSTKGPVLSEIPRVDSVLGSVAAQGVASFGANTIGGALNALGFTNAGAAAINKANQLANAATAAEGADITLGKRQIDSAIDKLAGSSNFQEAATNTGNLFSTIYRNPKAFGATVGSEIVEEILQIGALKFLPVGFWTKELISSATENGGAAYNTEYDKQIKAGASKETAHDAAQKAAGVAAGTTVALAGAAMGLGKVVGKVAGSTADEVTEGALGATKQVGKTTAKESMQEMIEEGSISAAVDMALRDKVDAKNFLVNVIGGGLYGGPTSGSMQATKLDTLDAQSTFIGSGLGADPAAVDRAIGNIQTLYGDDRATSLVGNLVNAENLGAAGQTLANDLSNVMGSDAAVNTANTLVGNLAISQMSDAIESQGIQLDSLSTVVGRTDTGNEITLGNALGASITGNGQSLPASTVIGTTLDGTNVTLGQVTSLIKTDTAITNTLTNAQTTTDPNTGITTTVTTNPTTNETVKLSVNPNTNITTQVTTSQNITSTTTVNANTNITTNTTVNTNTNTTTNTAFDAGSGEVVIQVVDNKSGLIVDTKFTSFDLLPADLKASLTVQSPDVKTTTTKPTVKKPIVQPKPVTKPPIQVPVIEDLGRLKGAMLESSGDPRLKDPLAALSQQVEQMNQIDPALLAVMAQRLGMQMPQVQQEPSFTYGEEKSIDEILGKKDESAESEKDRNYAQGGYVAPLQTMNVQFMNRGGYLGREDFKHGKHVAGEGDGQSDDIPAWLADSEFVLPADVVAALGNGSTKAGTDKLYEMMYAIRKRARSTGPKDLPPPAHKSPLDYIRKGK